MKQSNFAGLWGSAIASVLLVIPAVAGEYRIDSQEDFDRLKARTFQPGDTILFKRGSQFKGMFSPRGSGKGSAPITIDAYGKGGLPAIHAEGRHEAGLLLKDPSHWEVNRLEITNTDGSVKDQGDLYGIYVLATGAEGTFEHVHINECHVHDVNGQVAGKRRGGIHVHIKKLKRSRFHDLRITGNRIFRVGGVGIGNDSSCGDVAVGEGGGYEAKHLWTKVYVADNHVDHTGRNNIIARVSENAIYERNTLAHSSRHDTGHSIFNFNTVGIRIQFNEAYGNVGEGGTDRGGFDADYNSVNTLIQYNYSHDNLWFCGIMKKPNADVTIRYNVSQNDREGIYFYGFEGRKDASNIRIYNNTHFVRKGLKAQVIAENRTPLSSTFENNIFYFEGEGRWGSNAGGIRTAFYNNVYFNLPPHRSEENARLLDPLFIAPGNAGTDIDLTTMKALEGYRLRPTSPCLDGATQIEGHGGQNILGEVVEDQGQRYGAL
jgi:hypothetical protein